VLSLSFSESVGPCDGDIYQVHMFMVLGLWCLTPLSLMFQLYRGVQSFFVKETGVRGGNHRPVGSHKETLSHNVVSNTPHQRISNSQRVW